MPGSLSAAEFAAKWRDNARRERASSQEHFIDLCRMLGVQTPNEADPSGEWYTFEAGAERLSTGNQGWADVWKRGHFGWEYKGDHADLAAAYRQLLDYREDLANPPALVVSDMDRIEVHTNFTNTRPIIHSLTLEDLAAGGDKTAEALRILRAVMSEPGRCVRDRPPMRSRKRRPRGSPNSPAPCSNADTNLNRSRTSSIVCCSASSPRTLVCCQSNW